ncbi:hypothetical protein HGD85_03955 [Rhodobacteraceae bacterium R_SAG10]|jgi:hypothetical protein|nr:hypothetical protein [Rhodobacteraceae bacterium R_SAG10]
MDGLEVLAGSFEFCRSETSKKILRQMAQKRMAPHHAQVMQGRASFKALVTPDAYRSFPVWTMPDVLIMFLSILLVGYRRWRQKVSGYQWAQSYPNRSPKD